MVTFGFLQFFHYNLHHDLLLQLIPIQWIKIVQLRLQIKWECSNLTFWTISINLIIERNWSLLCAISFTMIINYSNNNRCSNWNSNILVESIPHLLSKKKNMLVEHNCLWWSLHVSQDHKIVCINSMTDVLDITYNLPNLTIPLYSLSAPIIRM